MFSGLSAAHVHRESVAVQSRRVRVEAGRRNVVAISITPGEEGNSTSAAATATATDPSTAAGMADVLWRFSRPHTTMGTTISVISISLLALQSSADLGAVALVGLTQALVSSLLANVSIVGLNQLYDIEIDKVNKPYLPLAAGDMTPEFANLVVWGTGVAALAIGVASGSAPLLATLAVSLALGVVYSTDVPFLRWKRFPFMAACCIFLVRAVIVQLGFYLHMRCAVLGLPLQWTQPLLFGTAFMSLCSVVIALFKDIPDVAGDRIANVRTLSVRLGVPRVFNICRALMLVAYGGAVVFGLCATTNVTSCLVTVALHASLAAIMWMKSQKVDLQDSKALYAFYMFIWKLFYAEYLVLPLLR